MTRKLTYGEMAAEVMEHVINHNAHGYSQPNRAGDGTVEAIRLSDGTIVRLHGGDYDCSELVRQCYECAGILGGFWDSYMWTGNEIDLLRGAGFAQVDKYNPKRGDVLWRQGHTEIYLGNNRQGGARRSEFHTANGYRGDQDGGEITFSAYNPGEWSSCWRCTRVRPGSSEPKPKPIPKQKEGKSANSYGLYYRVHVERAGWLAVAHDGQTAGTTGYGARIEAIKITPPEGVELEVNVHIQKLGDRTYKGIRRGASSGTGSSSNDPIIGTTGKSLRIEEVRIKVTKNTSAKLKGKTLMYRVHVQGSGWTGWGRDGAWLGTRGQSKRIEAIQMKFA